MSALLRGWPAAVGAAVLMTTSSVAGPPDPAYSIVPDVLVGADIGTEQLWFIPIFEVQVFDSDHNPVTNAIVSLHFAPASGASGLSNRVNPWSVQDTWSEVDCPAKTITSVVLTNVAGTVVIDANFGGAENSNSVQVVCQGIVIAHIKARSTDMDANGETDLGDLARFKGPYLSFPPMNAPEADFSLDGEVELADFAIFGQAYFKGAVVPPC
jgi:hypothetical protein